MEIDRAQSDAEPEEQQESYNPKSKSDTYVQQERFHRLPASADQVTHADPAQPDPKPHQKDQHQLRHKRAAIKQDSRALAVDRGVFGNFLKPFGQPFEPVANPIYDQLAAHLRARAPRDASRYPAPLPDDVPSLDGVRVGR